MGVLNDSDKIYLGSAEISKLYKGSSLLFEGAGGGGGGGGPVALVGYDWYESPNTTASFDLTVPASTAVGDVIVLLAGTSAATDDPSSTGLANLTLQATYGNSHANVRCWIKTAESGDASTNVTISDVGLKGSAVLASFSAASFQAAAADGSDLGGETTLVAPTVLSAAADSYLLTWHFARASAVTDLSTPAGMTLIQKNIGAGAGATYFVLCNETVGAGPTGTRTSTVTGTMGRDASVSVVLTPA